MRLARRSSNRVTKMKDRMGIRMVLWLLVLLFIATVNANWLEALLQRDQHDNIINSGDDMELTVDLSSSHKLPKRNELIIRIYNTHDHKVICQSYLVDHMASGVFKCSFTEGKVDFRNGPNYFEMELISSETGKRFARQLIPTIYHLDSTLYDGYQGIKLSNTNVSDYTQNILLSGGLSVGVKWGLDRLLDYIATTQPNYKPPRQPPRPPRRRSTPTTRRSPTATRRKPPAFKNTQTSPRQSTKSNGRLAALSPQNWKNIPRPTLSVSSEQVSALVKTLKYGAGGYLAFLLFTPTMRGGVSVLQRVVPQSMAVLKTAAGVVTSLPPAVGSIASRLLFFRKKYVVVDGYKVSLDSASFQTPPQPVAAAKSNNRNLPGGSLYSRWIRKREQQKKQTKTSSSSSSSTKNRPAAPRSSTPHYKRPKDGWLADAPPLTKARCPLRDFGVPLFVKNEDM